MLKLAMWCFILSRALTGLPTLFKGKNLATSFTNFIWLTTLKETLCHLKGYWQRHWENVHHIRKSYNRIKRYVLDKRYKELKCKPILRVRITWQPKILHPRNLVPTPYLSALNQSPHQKTKYVIVLNRQEKVTNFFRSIKLNNCCIAILQHY